MIKTTLSVSFLSTLLAASTLPTQAASQVPPAATKHWTADNGNGTYSNPLFYGEFEDPDPIRVGDDYYLAGTTMHMMPSVEILHSKDLVNWELASYCTNKLDLGPAYRLEGGSIYGNGIWAPCLRYHNGMFYVFCNVNGGGLHVFRSKSASGPWEHNQLPNRHDLSVLFDDDLKKIFIISGGQSPYPIEELSPDLRSFDTNAPKRQLVVPPGGPRMGEGHHLYKIKGKYYDVSAIPGGAVNQMVAKADSIDGPWEVTAMVDSESLGVTAAPPQRAQANDRGLWLHQGGIVDTPSGEWWCTIMSDHGSAGRMISLVPITWDNGFPLIGLPGNLRKAPNTWVKPNTGSTQQPKPTYVPDDIHPRDKKEVGERLALCALANHYGKKVVFSGPIFASGGPLPGALKLHFKNTDGGLVVKGKKLGEFAVAGEDRKWFWADARIEGDTVIVSSSKVPEPKAARYAWQANPTATLFNGAGMPATPFRTDDWPGLTEKNK